MTTRNEYGVRGWLKADLHIHTHEHQRGSGSGYDARQLIKRASRDGYQVLSITNHDQIVFDQELKGFAAEHGITLLPGIELSVEHRHVLIITPERRVSGKKIRTFSDLKGLRAEGALIIAPHPFFPSLHSLGRKLIKNIELFDAIEYSHFYLPRINFNKKAEEMAKRYNKPLIGTSDAHTWLQFGTTYSLIEAENQPEAIIMAIKRGAVRIITRPLDLLYAIKCYLEICRNELLKRYI